MGWIKAKKFTIIVLVILNIVLLVLNIYKSFDTRLSYSRINALNSILKSNNITLSTKLPTSFKPMAEINASEYSFDHIKLQKIFLSGQSNVKRTEEYNSVIFISDTSRLSVKGSSINYTTTLSYSVNSDEMAKEYADKLVNSINSEFGKFKFYSIYNTNDGYVIKYYEKKDGYNIFSNFAYFTIKENNVSVAINYVKLGSTIDTKNNIYAADEALYSAVKSIKKEIEKPVITDVKLGYYAIKINSAGEVVAIPFYLIGVNNKEYYVNAYTGECFWCKYIDKTIIIDNINIQKRKFNRGKL